MARTATRRAPATARAAIDGPASPRAARGWFVALLAAHAVLSGWAALRTSVTFDENFHLPAGVMIVERGDYTGSVAQPPLAKILYALPAIALGAHLPTAAAMATGDEGTIGESFMRQNAARFTALYLAARMVGILFSLALALLVWQWARVLYGEWAGTLAAALYTLCPESLAHAGVVGTDLPTATAFTAALYAFWRFANAPGGKTWAMTALAVAAAFITRFSAVELAPVFVVSAMLAWGTGRLPRPGRVWLGLLMLVATTWLAIIAAYGWGVYTGPLGALPFRSDAFRELVAHWPRLRLPLPMAYYGGLDYMSMIGQPDRVRTYLLGRIRMGAVWYYFPLALLFKWPLGLWGAVMARVFVRAPRRGPPGLPAAWLFAVAAVVMLTFAMFITRYNFGVRYMLPLLPLACVWCGGLLAGTGAALARPASAASQSRRGIARVVAGALVALLAIESLAAAPRWLAFFNWPSGGPGGGYRLLNDSNVDWGQGLIALREAMRERGITRILLAYHGTTDPALYGIDYVPYLGGAPGPESDWLAVSSYYFVGLSQRMMTQRGRTPRAVRLDFRPLWNRPWAAEPAGCMFLFRIR
jgi:dolichyl-phosphate-mannose-protein mannosyltransferase